jgi:hypothetical protein
MDENIKWLIGAFLALIVAWVATGGPERESARQGVFLHPVYSTGTGIPYGGSYLYPSPDSEKSKLVTPETNIAPLVEGAEAIADKLKKAQNINLPSMFLKTLLLDGTVGAKATDPQQEYVRITAPDKNRRDISITGLTLKSAISEIPFTIGKGVKTFLSGTVSESESIVLAPGQSAIVLSGRSPVGVSFRENVCSGYLGQFQNFAPTLRKECPSAVDELSRVGLGNDKSCEAFVSEIPRCSTYTGTIPEGLSAQCKAFVQKNLTYNSCVLAHQYESNFIGNVWRVYLGNTKEIWRKDTEMIRLANGAGDTIDALVY